MTISCPNLTDELWPCNDCDRKVYFLSCKKINTLFYIFKTFPWFLSFSKEFIHLVGQKVKIKTSWLSQARGALFHSLAMDWHLADEEDHRNKRLMLWSHFTANPFIDVTFSDQTRNMTFTTFVRRHFVFGSQIQPNLSYRLAKSHMSCQTRTTCY